ncbi:hypothetical protein ABIB82_001359 [Bradyrhizobium sp. i1.8.4]|uniref:hypothetical protein n=1 Tax=unclassified Bradyrhizobium TaxID=2631580 RepID=UPI003D1B502E
MHSLIANDYVSSQSGSTHWSAELMGAGLPGSASGQKTDFGESRLEIRFGPTTEVVVLTSCLIGAGEAEHRLAAQRS